MALLNRLRLAARFSCPSNRAYGSAAAVQLDYDFDYYDNEDNNAGGYSNRTPRIMEDSDGLVPVRGVQWVIIGDPMAKRNVYAQWLSKLLDVPHISMGSLVRQELHPHSSLHNQITSAVNEGKLVPAEVIFRLLSKRLEEGYCRGENGFILDGIPRTKVQAEILDQVVDIDLVLNLKCQEDSMVKKCASSGVHPCQEFLCMTTSKFDLGPQPDDGNLKFTNYSDGAWREKLRVYAEQSQPLEEYYRKQRKLLDFQVSGAPGETWQGLLAALHLQHMNVVSSSQKLTA
ncbi:probable adenylate kinase 7, mitochondrial [Ipomoea triloba]|uniref:probable adenylate kinase 7, mitochondrial n=1 Tax=Ipomoea triloba TaxID=35885 RepID=UPI00125E01F2|nr:probable adenylate kinase 7, mitochondrial [Ipomoea triloba]